MASTIWEVTVKTRDFVAVVVIDNISGTANVAICPTSSAKPVCKQIKKFDFKKEFKVGGYDFSNGTAKGKRKYVGDVKYLGPLETETNWTAQKK